MRKEILVPESTMEIQMHRYQRLMVETKRQDEFRFIFSCLTGCEETDVDLIKAKDVERAANALVNALHDVNAPLMKKIELNGVKYGFEPELDNITFGMMADLKTHFDNPANWHKVLAILYRPIVREKKSKAWDMYAIEAHQAHSDAYKERQRVFKNAPASLFVGARGFFLRGSKKLSNHIRYSSKIQEAIQNFQPKHANNKKTNQD